MGTRDWKDVGCWGEDEEELVGEDHVGGTRWGNAGQILHGYENVRKISQRNDEGWEGSLLFV